VVESRLGAFRCPGFDLVFLKAAEGLQGVDCVNCPLGAHHGVLLSRVQSDRSVTDATAENDPIGVDPTIRHLLTIYRGGCLLKALKGLLLVSYVKCPLALRTALNQSAVSFENSGGTFFWIKRRCGTLFHALVLKNTHALAIRIRHNVSNFAIAKL